MTKNMPRLRLFLCLMLVTLFGIPAMQASANVPANPMAIETSSSDLQLWLEADKGITLAAGRVSQWNDQSGNGNNVTQSTAANQPAYVDGGPRESAVSFEYSSSTPSNYMTLASGLSTNRASFSCFAVVECDNLVDQQCLMCYGANNANIYLYNGLLTAYTGGVSSSTLRPSSTLCIIGYTTNGSTSKMWMNGDSSTIANYGTGSYTGGYLGSINGSNSYWEGNVREVVQFAHGLSTTEVEELEDYFSTKYNIQMNHTVNVLCDGDSITAGVDSTLNLNYPIQLARLAASSGVRVRQWGRPSKTMEYIAGQASTSVDLAYDSSASQNILVIFAGTNSLATSIGNESGATAYAALVSYCQARRAAYPGLKIVVVTMLPRNSTANGSDAWSVDQGIFNTDIRTNYTSFADAVADVAANPDFSAYTNYPYFNADNTHPSDVGYGVVAYTVWKAIQQVMNPTPRVVRPILKVTMPKIYRVAL